MKWGMELSLLANHFVIVSHIGNNSYTHLELRILLYLQCYTGTKRCICKKLYIQFVFRACSICFK